MLLSPLKASWPSLVNLSSPYRSDSPNVPHPYFLPPHALSPGLQWQPPHWSLQLWSVLWSPILHITAQTIFLKSRSHVTSLPKPVLGLPIFLRRKSKLLPLHEGPYKILQTWSRWSPSLAPPYSTLLGACSPITLSLASHTHHGASHVCAFAPVGCATWNTFPIFLHLDTIYFLNSLQMSPLPGRLPGCPGSA